MKSKSCSALLLQALRTISNRNVEEETEIRGSKIKKIKKNPFILFHFILQQVFGQVESVVQALV